MLLDLPYGRCDLLHVVLISEQGELRYPHRFPRCRLCGRIGSFQDLLIVMPELAWESLLEDPALEEIQFVNWRVARLMGYTLGNHPLDKEVD